VDARIEQVVTSGTCTLDDTEYEVDNNTWIVGDDEEVIVIDPAHDAEAILKVVGERVILAVICTHGHEDHLSAALEVAEADEEDPAPIALHPRDRKLWRAYFSRLGQKDMPEPDIDMDDGGVFEVGDVQLDVIHTPGHTPGSVCVYSELLGALFSGDTLHKGKPGEVGGLYPDITTQLNSIGALLGPLPKDTRVLPGHGEETSIGDEDGRWESWFSLAQSPSDAAASSGTDTGISATATGIPTTGVRKSVESVETGSDADEKKTKKTKTKKTAKTKKTKKDADDSDAGEPEVDGADRDDRDDRDN
jgi:glyoxylase-like metal-dependent hydrolase (beta-lactamase superfamily II)